MLEERLVIAKYQRPEDLKNRNIFLTVPESKSPRSNSASSKFSRGS
jgi:hypothetical protein